MRIYYWRVAGIRDQRNAILVRWVWESRQLIVVHQNAITKRIGESEHGRKGGI